MAPASKPSIHDGSSQNQGPPLCLDRVATDVYDGLVGLPDGSGQALLWSRKGLIWLAISDGTAVAAGLRVQPEPVMDLSGRVTLDPTRGLGGLISVAVGPSGRTFASYTVQAPDSDCPSLVVDEILSTGQATRVLEMRLQPQAQSLNSGQLLFRPGPADSFLYLVIGPAGDSPDSSSQILKLHLADVGPGTGTTTPNHVFATFLGSPNRCAFDSAEPENMYCAVEALQDVIILISDASSPAATTTTIAAHQPTPTMEGPSILGGLLYRGSADASFRGSYVYTHASAVWMLLQSPVNSSRYTAPQIAPLICSASTPFPCRDGAIAGSITAFGEDGSKDAFILATDGVYKLVSSSRCQTTTTPQSSTHKGMDPTLTQVLSVLGLVLGALLTAVGAYKIRSIYCCSHCCNDY